MLSVIIYSKEDGSGYRSKYHPNLDDAGFSSTKNSAKGYQQSRNI